MSEVKQPTNLTWTDTTKEDCYQISSWSDKNLLTVKTDATSEAVDKLNRFLNASPNNGLGSFLLGYIKNSLVIFIIMKKILIGIIIPMLNMVLKVHMTKIS